MGFFNFSKSKEQKEKEELMQKMQQQVFPGGNDQMNREVKEVRELLDFKYSLEEVKQTYVHAAAMYFIAKDKSQDRIITSILYNDKSVVTKVDAIKIYNYLAERNKPKNVFEQLSQTVNSLDDSIKLFFAAKGGIVPLKKYRDLTDEGKFEVILFNSLSVLNHYQSEYPEKYSEIEEEYFKSLFNQADTFNLHFDTEELADFINSRLRFYSGEVDKLYDGGQYMPAKIYNAFYENPLCNEPEVSMDLVQVMSFYAALTDMMNWVNDNIKKI